MGLNLNDGRVQIELTLGIAGFIAFCMTVLRLWIRRDRYWWDDAWAFISLLNLFVQFAGVIMHVEDPSKLSKDNRVAAYYLMACSFYTVIWSARTSILFSIIRIDPDPESRRKLKWLAGAFIGAIAFFIAQILWVCEPDGSWKNLPSPQCRLNKEVAICQLVSDIIADCLLITLPLRLIRGIRDKRLRHRVMFIFSTSIVTTIVSLVHAAYIIRSGGPKVLIGALVELCMSLTVANVPIVGSAFTRVVSRNDTSAKAFAGEDPDGGQRWSTLQFRRVTGNYAVTTTTASAVPLTQGNADDYSVSQHTSTTLSSSMTK